MHPHCEETVKKSRADRRIGILGFKQHVGNKYSAARAFGSFGDPKEQRSFQMDYRIGCHNIPVVAEIHG